MPSHERRKLVVPLRIWNRRIGTVERRRLRVPLGGVASVGPYALLLRLLRIVLTGHSPQSFCRLNKVERRRHPQLSRGARLAIVGECHERGFDDLSLGPAPNSSSFRTNYADRRQRWRPGAAGRIGVKWDQPHSIADPRRKGCATAPDGHVSQLAHVARTGWTPGRARRRRRRSALPSEWRSKQQAFPASAGMSSCGVRSGGKALSGPVEAVVEVRRGSGRASPRPRGRGWSPRPRCGRRRASGWSTPTGLTSRSSSARRSFACSARGSRRSRRGTACRRRRSRTGPVRRDGAGERALLVAEQLALQQLVGGSRRS